MASVRLLIGIGLLLAIISQTGAGNMCYVCEGVECHHEDIPVEDCGSKLCVFSYEVDSEGVRVELRYCSIAQNGAAGCHDLGQGKGKECYCSKDLCNTPELWSSKPRSSPKPAEFAASTVPSATPLLIILGSLITASGGIFPLSKKGKGSVSLLLGIGLLAIISQAAASKTNIKCYKCSAGCGKEPIPEEDCPPGPEYLCVFSYVPHPEAVGKLERRDCSDSAKDLGKGCHDFKEGKGQECFCAEDLCNSEKIWEPEPTTGETGGTVNFVKAASPLPSATPLLIILGSLITAAGGVIVGFSI